MCFTRKKIKVHDPVNLAFQVVYDDLARALGQRRVWMRSVMLTETSHKLSWCINAIRSRTRKPNYWISSPFPTNLLSLLRETRIVYNWQTCSTSKRRRIGDFLLSFSLASVSETPRSSFEPKIDGEVVSTTQSTLRYRRKWFEPFLDMLQANKPYASRHVQEREGVFDLSYLFEG